MGRIASTLIGAAGLGAVLGSAAITMPANALVIPNGSFSYSLPGSNSVDTTNIASDTSQLTLANGPPGAMITSFVDPFDENPNNFCIGAGAGCTAAHPPGFLGSGSPVLLSQLVLPVGNSTQVPETVTAETNFGAPAGVVSVDFAYTTEFTIALTPTTSTAAGSLDLGFIGTFDSDSTSHMLGELADMTIMCTQSTIGAAITCSWQRQYAGAPLSTDAGRARTGIIGPARTRTVWLRRLPSSPQAKPKSAELSRDKGDEFLADQLFHIHAQLDRVIEDREQARQRYLDENRLPDAS